MWLKLHCARFAARVHRRMYAANLARSNSKNDNSFKIKASRFAINLVGERTTPQPTSPKTVAEVGNAPTQHAEATDGCLWKSAQRHTQPNGSGRRSRPKQRPADP